MVQNTILTKAPEDWTPQDWEGIEIPEFFTIEQVPELTHYLVLPINNELDIDINIRRAGWRFTLDQGNSWIWVRYFDDLPPRVKDYWHSQVEKGINKTIA